jgi:hypothetical protein
MKFRQVITAVMISVMTSTALLGLAAAAAAQSVVALNTAVAPPPSAAPVDVSRLPISLRRIERSLRQSAIREERDGLNLRYFVDVYAKAPALVLFTKEDNLLTGPVPYGGPTHREMLDMITPQEHRAPAADFGALMRWLSGKKDKK